MSTKPLPPWFCHTADMECVPKLPADAPCPVCLGVPSSAALRQLRKHEQRMCAAHVCLSWRLLRLTSSHVCDVLMPTPQASTAA